MAILDRFRLGKGTRDMLAGPINLGASPWATGSLDRISWELFSDLGYDVAAFPMSRKLAMTIPAVAKARNLLVSAVAGFPLVAMTSAGVLPTGDQPTFLYRTDDAQTPHERMAWTVDDCIFNGRALWFNARGADKDGRKSILSSVYVPPSLWTITEGKILVDEQPVDDDEVILFNPPFEGLLNIASRTLRGARDQEAAWVGRARNPIPLIELHQTDDSLTDDQVAPFVEAWAKARRSEDGAIGYTPQGLQINVHGDVSADLMVAGRDAVRTDIGSFLNVRASMLDGTTGVDSLTYATQEGQRNAFYEFDLPFWTDPIEARLSMDDIVPRGQRVRFDKYQEYAPTPTPTGEPTES